MTGVPGDHFTRFSSASTWACVVKKATEPDEWRKKYFDSLASLESEQQKFRAMETVLKRVSGRLCIAALDQSPRLDGEIKKLQAALRRESTPDELEKITAALTDAINALDQPQSAAPDTETENAGKPSDPSLETIANDEPLRAVLSTLLMELRRDPELTIQADELDAQLANALTRAQLPDVLARLTDMVGKRIQRIERTKQEIETLLSLMVGRLDEIGRFVVDQGRSQSESLASSETLNIQLTGEMQAMGDSMDASADLQQLRTQVRRRLDSIGQHLQEFRQRETERAEAMRARSEQMQARVAELEAEAKRLNNQLQDEQRLSTMDVLTKIPNRLAYEKRMEEELKRWQRFKQPTCMAVWDVDHFKRINDTYGHRAGDRVLRAVAESLAGRIRSTDFLARYGGEEFVMLLCGTKLEDAMPLVEEMRTAVSKLALHFRGTPFSITISCGITLLCAGDAVDTVFDRADQALYQAKAAGRNRCISN